MEAGRDRSPTAGPIAAATSMGAVHLTVRDLGRSLDYYGQVIGLGVLDRAAGRASLAAGERELVVLVEEPGARPGDGYTGLFHLALLVPARADLARFLAHAARNRVQLAGLSDHFVSEAIYLADPDRHGIEVYADRPRAVWQGTVAERMTTLPLDVAGLLAELDDPASEPFDGLPAGTAMGHVHLRAAEIPGIVAFYRDVMGFELTAALGPQAAFFGAGGYHHHLGANTWQSRGAPPPPPGTAALRHATVVFPDTEERDRVLARVAAAGAPVEETGGEPLVRDPSGNRLVLTTA